MTVIEPPAPELKQDSGKVEEVKGETKARTTSTGTATSTSIRTSPRPPPAATTPAKTSRAIKRRSLVPSRLRTIWSGSF